MPQVGNERESITEPGIELVNLYNTKHIAVNIIRIEMCTKSHLRLFTSKEVAITAKGAAKANSRIANPQIPKMSERNRYNHFFPLQVLIDRKPKNKQRICIWLVFKNIIYLATGDLLKNFFYSFRLLVIVIPK